jgi:rhodanese-related sulfurtransferase
MKKAVFLITVLAFSFALVMNAAAQAPAQPKWMATQTKQMVDHARAVTKQVTIQDLKKAIDAKEDLVILDVRDPNEYQVAHIPGAVNVSRGLLEFVIWNIVPDKNAKIFVYCKTGARAALATKQLNEFGYKNAVSVDTGGVAWAKAGYPIQTSITDDEIIIMPAKK